MNDPIRELVRSWDGHAVVMHFDAPSNTWFFIAIHDVTLGPAIGGCRMQTYPTPEEGLRDAMRLAEGMTYKWAAIKTPFGGGKSVLAVPGPISGKPRAELFQRFGTLVESLRGGFATGVDMGTTPEDMQTLRRSTRYVMGLTDDARVAIDPGPYTALGVFTGLQAAVRHVYDDVGLNGRTVLVQGVGDVGGPLARMLAEAGASLLISDLDQDRADRLAEAVDGRTVPPDRIFGTDCDVFAPCAIGGILNMDSIPRLRCSVIAGSANNQLETDEDALRLHSEGILYTPDYILNAGGAIAFALIQQGEEDAAALNSAVRRIGGTLEEILEEAVYNQQPPTVIARRKAERVLERAREEQLASVR